MLRWSGLDDTYLQAKLWRLFNDLWILEPSRIWLSIVSFKPSIWCGVAGPCPALSLWGLHRSSLRFWSYKRVSTVYFIFILYHTFLIFHKRIFININQLLSWQRMRVLVSILLSFPGRLHSEQKKDAKVTDNRDLLMVLYGDDGMEEKDGW